MRLSEKERLQPKKNPFFAHADHQLLLAWQSGAVVGRLAVFDDRLHNDVHRDNIVSFGFFEADDDAAARALFASAEAWGLRHGRTRMRGPLNPSLNESAGLLIDGFDTDSMLMMPHNPREYAGFIESAGYRKVKDLYAWLYDIERGIDPIIERLAIRMRERHHDHGAAALGRRVRARGRAAPRHLLRRVGAELGLRAADRPTNSSGSPPS